VAAPDPARLTATFRREYAERLTPLLVQKFFLFGHVRAILLFFWSASTAFCPFHHLEIGRTAFPLQYLIFSRCSLFLTGSSQVSTFFFFPSRSQSAMASPIHCLPRKRKTIAPQIFFPRDFLFVRAMSPCSLCPTKFQATPSPLPRLSARPALFAGPIFFQSPI